MKYICYYDIDDRENRKYFLSAKAKIDYICKIIKNILPEKAEILSASSTKGSKYCPARTTQVDDNTTLKLFSSFGKKNIITKTLDYILIPVSLFFYMIKNTRKDEIVIVYHSLSLIYAVKFAKFFRKFRLILEFEEIYSDVAATKNKKNRKRELGFCKYADAFIFATKSLNDEVNKNNKPFVICNGTYKVEPERANLIDFGENNAKKTVHCVYAGIFDSRKGVVAAIKSALYLSENFHIHIIGFGTERDTENTKKLISEINSQTKATVTYDGIKSGEEYIRFLQSCDIGLSTQNPDAKFNATSFPSKILSYLSNGLRVVSVRIPAVEQSEVGSELYFYDKQDPQEIAKAILNVDITKKYDGRKLIKALDEQFVGDLKKLLLV